MASRTVQLIREGLIYGDAQPAVSSTCASRSGSTSAGSKLRFDFDVYNIFNSSWPYTVSLDLLDRAPRASGCGRPTCSRAASSSSADSSASRTARRPRTVSEGTRKGGAQSERLVCASLLVFRAAAPAARGRAARAPHRLPPIPLEILQRPIALRTGIGRAHDDTSTTSKDAQALYDQGLALSARVRLDRCRTLVQRGAHARSEAGSGTGGTQRRVCRTESAGPRRGRPSTPREHWRRRFPITIAVTSRRGRCRWRPRTIRAMPHGWPRTGRRWTERSQRFRRTSSCSCCAALRSRPIPRTAARAARRHRPRISRRCSRWHPATSPPTTF